METLSGASIRIIKGDQLLKCASENEEVLQIDGELVNVQDALFRVTSKLHENYFPGKTLHGTGMTGAYPSSHNEKASDGRVVTASLGFYPSVGPSHKLESREHQDTLAHNLDLVGLPTSIEQPLSPRVWAPQVSRNPSVLEITLGIIKSYLKTKLGRQGMACARKHLLLFEADQITKAPLDRVETYKTTHFIEGKEGNPGTWTKPEAEANYEHMVELQKQTHPEGRPFTPDEIGDKVLGTRPGYVRGLGYGEPSRPSSALAYRNHADLEDARRRAIDAEKRAQELELRIQSRNMEIQSQRECMDAMLVETLIQRIESNSSAMA